MNTRWLAGRIAQVFFTIISVITLTFVLIRMIPGGPMSYLRATLRDRDGLTREDMSSMIEVYTNINPDQPLWVQYVDYVTSVLQGDLGVSIWQQEPVAQILGQAMPWTIYLMSVAMFLSFVIGVAVGATMAYMEGGKFDVSMTMASVVLTSVPYYVFAIVLLYLFAYQGPFPTGGRVAADVEAGFNVAFLKSVVWHSVLPIFSMVLTGFGGTAISMRGNSIRVLGEDYLRVARLRGLPRRTIALRYVARNAVLPMYTGLMIGIGFMFGGSIILEEIFKYPGIGYYMFQAISSRDYTLMMGAFLLITIAVAISIFVADLTYGKIDPRAKTGGGGREAY